jgi:hypothetical protein
MYNHWPPDMKKVISPILFGDQQMSAVVNDFYRDQSFCRDGNGNINLRKLYNLFTGAGKSTYIDQYLDWCVNAFPLVQQIKHSLESKGNCWYMN